MNEREKVVEELCRGYCKVCGGKIEGSILDFSRLMQEPKVEKCFQCAIKEVESFFRTTAEVLKFREGKKEEK